MKRPVVLIGMMGSGKTSVGRALALRLGRPWVDLDQVLVKRWGPIARQFAESGEPLFRRRESSELLRLGRKGLVLSTGGGVVLSSANRRWLAKQVSVYLQVPVPELSRRLRGAQRGARPLLKGKPLDATLKRLARHRVPLYRQAATLTLRAGTAVPDRLAARLAQRLRAFSLS